MKKITFLFFALSLSMITISQNVAVSAITTDWWPQLGQDATDFTTPNGWYYRANAGSERLAFDGTFYSGTSCATTFGAIGSPYTDMSIKFDMTMPPPGSGKSSIIILGSNAVWGGQGIIIEYTEFGVRALKNFDYGGMTWLGSGTGYTDALGTGGLIANNEINISATGVISLKFGAFVCPTTYQADVTVLANAFVLVCPFATGFKFKNVIAKKGALAKSYFPNYSYAIAATSSDEAKGTVAGAGSYDKTSDVTLTATPLAGNKFVNWTEGGAEVSNSASYTFSATAARTLVANFSISTATHATLSNSLNVYPNPSNGIITLSNESVGSSYIITNTLGQKVQKGLIENQLQKLNLTNLSAGNFFLMVNDKNGKMVKTISIH